HGSRISSKANGQQQDITRTHSAELSRPNLGRTADAPTLRKANRPRATWAAGKVHAGGNVGHATPLAVPSLSRRLAHRPKQSVSTVRISNASSSPARDCTHRWLNQSIFQLTP